MGKGRGTAAAEPQREVKELKDKFFWSDKMEPHAARKRELIKKYGKEINKLMAPDPNSKWICMAVVVAHIATGAILCQMSWIPFLLGTYILGASFTHNLFLAIHEVTHHLAFKSKFMNDCLAMFCNIPIVIPYAMYFKQYHYEHHRYQGWDGVDLDLPCAIEAKLLESTPGKLFFLIFQGLFYALRPTFLKPLAMTPIRAMNYGLVLGADALMFYAFGPNIFLYFLLSLLLGTGINPFAGHFISEHYLMEREELKDEGQETYSYYGWLNIFSWNVGYHNEHHDFPNIPGSRLYRLREIAPEYYNNLKTTDSWFGAQMKFLFDPRVSLWCRMLREKDAARRSGDLVPTTSDSKGGNACFSN